MKLLDPGKLHVSYGTGTGADNLMLPRRYTLTHSDRTGDLYLFIGREFNKKQASGLYTRLMRDEVFAEISGDEPNPVFRVYCHVSGGIVIGTAGWRYRIFRSELPLVLEAFRFGDRVLFEKNPALGEIPVLIHYISSQNRYNKIETMGKISDYI
jgi:hypothetical protein